MRAWSLCLVAVTAFGWACASEVVADSRFDETLTAQRVDGSTLELFISRPVSTARVPIVLQIDGSGCVSGTRERFRTTVASIPRLVGTPIATVVVEKPGVARGADWGSPCSETFSRYYSIDQRVLDHLRAIQHLRKHAKWWNGEIYLFGWSDGGAIGVHVAAYVPEVRRAVFGGTGGGIPMNKQFEDYIACAPDRTKDRAACIADLRRRFQEMRDHPTPLETWSGQDNTYRTWATRLDAVEFHLFKDIEIPVLIVHGASDRDGTPVESARELMRMLRTIGATNFEYWEIPEMEHAIGNVPDERREKLESAMYNWLFSQPLGPGGPPTFGL